MKILSYLLILFLPTYPVGAGEKVLVKAVNLEKLNTEADEDDPFQGADGNLYYASNKAGRWEILIAKKTSGGSYGAGKRYLSSNEADHRSPFFFQGSLFFAHNKVPDEKLKDLKNFDLVKMTGDRAPLPLPGISTQEDELHPWITSAAKEFYFSRKLADGWKLFVASGPALGPIGEAKEVGFPPGYHHATLSSGTLLMYVQGPLEKNRTGIFRSRRSKVGAAWSVPEPVAGLNHSMAKLGDMSPSLSADGARLFFVSDRPGGKGGLDIWMLFTRDLK